MRRTSFNKATSPAKEGAEADVPPMRVELPFKNILKLSAWVETSGYACTKKPMTIIVRQKKVKKP